MSNTYLVMQDDDASFEELVAKVQKAKMEGVDDEILGAALYGLTMRCGVTIGITALTEEEGADTVTGLDALRTLLNDIPLVYNEVLFAAGLPPVQS